MISRFFRTLATIFAYFCFIFGALLQGIIVYLFLTFFVWSKTKRQRYLRKCVKFSFRIFLFICSVLRVFKVKCCDLSILRDPKAKIIIANHPTLIDYVVLCSQLSENCNAMVKSKLLKGFMRPIIKHLGYVSNESSLDDIENVAKSHEELLIFPEGTRTKDPKALKFMRGAANISCRLNLSIYPIYIYCDEPGFLSSKFLNIYAPPKMPTIYVEVGEVIDPNSYINDEHLAVAARHLNQELEQLYQNNLEKLEKKLRNR